MSEDLSKKILQNIKDKKIKPSAKWEFIAKEYSIWFGFIVSLILGTFAVSLTLFMLSISDLGLAKHLHDSNLSFWLHNIPFLWLFTFGVFILLAQFSFQHTKRGYKFTLFQIIIANLLISLIVGTGLHFIGFSKRMDKLALERVPMYERFAFQKQMDFWNQTDKGFLAGRVETVINEHNLKLRDFQDKEWEVILKRDMPNSVHIKEGILLKLLGEASADNIFEAQEIRIWEANFKGPRSKPFLRKNTAPKPMIEM